MLTVDERANFNRLAIRIAVLDPDIALELLELIEIASRPRVFDPKQYRGQYPEALRILNGPVVSKKPWNLRDLRLQGFNHLAGALNRHGVTDSKKMAKRRWEEVLNWPGFGKARVANLRTVCDAE